MTITYDNLQFLADRLDQLEGRLGRLEIVVERLASFHGEQFAGGIPRDAIHSLKADVEQMISVMVDRESADRALQQHRNGKSRDVGEIIDELADTVRPTRVDSLDDSG